MDVRGLPRTHNGPLAWTGCAPNFAIAHFCNVGPAYPTAAFIQRITDRVANATYGKGALTCRVGGREYYPVPTRDAVMNQPSPVAPGGLGSTGNGLYFLNMRNATVAVCGASGIPSNCGINVSKRLLAPSIGIAYRPSEKFVIRAGYSL